LNVHGVNNVRQTSEPLVPEPSLPQVQITTENLKRYKSSGIDQIPAQMEKTASNTLSSDIQKVINCIWNRK